MNVNPYEMNRVTRETGVLAGVLDAAPVEKVQKAGYSPISPAARR
jgi:hypothetical protein